MKHFQRILSKRFFNRTIFLLASVFYLSIAIAQDKKVEIDIGVHKEPVWYQQPWAWVVGAAIFILLLVAFTRQQKIKTTKQYLLLIASG